MKLQCVVVTPEKALLDQEADILILPLFDGEMGILPRRAPLVSKLGYGCLTLKNEGAVQVFFIEGGTVQFSKNVATLLTPRAVDVSALDVAGAKKILDSAKPEGQSQTDRSAALEKARALIRASARAPRK